jgi:hypothetical protein
MRRKWLLIAIMCCVASLSESRLAEAGMPTVSLSDFARLRVQTMSFFLVGFFLSAWIIQKLANSLRTDFTKLPRLTYPKSCAVVFLWGLLFVIVLTMISGARELMTPGAWVKSGWTHKLADTNAKKEPETRDGEDLTRRRTRLEYLRAALMQHAAEHAGQFPQSLTELGIPEDSWQMPELTGVPYLYVGGLTQDDQDRVLVYEPRVYPGPRFALFTGGGILPLGDIELQRKLNRSESEE